MRVVRLLAMTVFLGVAAACGEREPQAPSAVPSPEESAAAPSTAASAPGGGATGRFPVPIAEGGEIVSEFPGEVTVAYPTALTEALVGFYRGYDVERGGVGGDTFDDGIEYQFQQDGETIVLSVTPGASSTVVLIRVLP
jgi:hypothetical protein